MKPDSKRSLFASDRERRFWIWTVVVVFTVYATLGLASRLAQSLNNQGLSAVVMLFCMGLIGLAVLTQRLQTRPRGIEVGVGLGIAAVYLMVLLRLTIPERSHLIEYSVVAILIYEALTERAAHGRRVPMPALLAVLATSAIGAVDESIQLFLPSRYFDWTDMLFNFLASLMAIVSMAVLRWGRRMALSAIRKESGEPRQ